MRPSTYDDIPAADTVVEDRDQVKVTFKGGNVFWLEVEGADNHELKRGAKAAWERAEKLRKELNDEYAGPPAAPTDETAPPAPSDEDEGEGEGGDQSPPDKSEPETKPDEPKASPPEAPKAQPPEAAAPQVDKEYRVGDVVGVQRMVPVDLVMDILGGEAGRVALLQGSDEARRLSRRVRATDGRCAPIFLTKQDLDDKEEVPALFDGLFTLAAAKNIGLDRVAVVILPAGKAGAVQGLISGLARANMSTDPDDDEMVYRAHSDN